MARAWKKPSFSNRTLPPTDWIAEKLTCAVEVLFRQRSPEGRPVAMMAEIGTSVAAHTGRPSAKTIRH